MKTIDKIAILCILALAASCSQKPVTPEPVTPEVKPETRTLTFVLPEIVLEEGEEAPAAMKTAWVAGDQIVVHGEYAKNQVTVTLAAGDISADGKSATVTVDNLYPYKREDCTSTLTACAASCPFPWRGTTKATCCPPPRRRRWDTNSCR